MGGYIGASVVGLSTVSADIDGTVTADGLTVDGIVTIDENDPQVRFLENDTTDLNTQLRLNGGNLTFRTIDDAITTATSRLNIDNSTGDVSFYEDTGSTVKMFWDASSEVLRIGTIGTSSAKPLMVKSDSSDHAIHIEENSGTEGYTIGVNVDGDLGFYNSASSTASVVFNDSGNVGVGTISPSLGSNATGLHIKGASGDYGVLKVDSSTTSEEGWVQFSNNGVDKFRIASDSSTNLKFIHSGVAERMRLNSDGDLLIGSTGTNYGEKVKILNTSSSGNCMFLWHNNLTDRSMIIMRNNAASGAGFNTMLDFLDSGGGSSGSIKISSTTTQYNTSSDYRLKENITDVTDGITRLKQLSPRRFNWITDESNTFVDGFIAHEAQTVVPEAVSGTKDGIKDEEYEVSAATGDIYTPAVDAIVDEEGNEVSAAVDEVIHSSNVEQPETLEEGQLWRETTAAVMGTRSVPDYQGIDQSKLVPLLTAALQESIAKIEALETRVAALEAN